MDEGALRALPVGSYPAGTEMRRGGGGWEALPGELGGRLGVPMAGLWVRTPEGRDVGPMPAAVLRNLVESEGWAADVEVFWEGAESMATVGQVLAELVARERMAKVEEARANAAAGRAAGDAMVPVEGEYGAGMRGLGWMLVGGGLVLVGLGLVLPGAGAAAVAGLGQSAVLVGGLVLVGDAVARRVERAIGKAEERKSG
jgi:hypothetical protein